MDENHQDKAESRPIAMEDKLSPPPLSTKDHRVSDRSQNKRMGAILRRFVGAIIKGLGFFGYDKETKEYAPNGQLAKITKEHQPGKTFWDWLQLVGVLLIPLVIFYATIGFNQQQDQLAQQQHQTDLQIANDQQQETALQNYLDRMSDLLLNYNLSKSKPSDEVREVARSRTLTLLPQLNGTRKREVLQFLHESGLIHTGHDTIVSLAGADLSHTDLRDANLEDADLEGAHLSGAVLSHTDLRSAYLRGADLRAANLEGANLINAYLRDANLSGIGRSKCYNTTNIGLICVAGIVTNLRGADLRGAILEGTNLSGADLSNADLRGANLTDATVTQQQLDQVSSCKGATLPQGLICHHNQ